jgi:hypothetical protein
MSRIGPECPYVSFRRQQRTCPPMRLWTRSANSGREQVRQRTASPPHAILASGQLARPYLGSFNRGVGARRKAGWYVEAECPRCNQIDNEFKLRGLDHRHVRWVRASQDLSGHETDLTKHVIDVGAVAHQPACLRTLTTELNHGQNVAHCQQRKLHAPAGKETVGRL